MGIIKDALFLIGGVIGAGFISGAELVRFFHTEYFLLPVACSSALFALLAAFFLCLGKRHGGYRGTLRALFGRGAGGAEIALALSSLVPTAGMLAGLDALLPQAKPILSLFGLAVTLFVLRRGTKGISRLNAVLVPLLLGFVFMCGWREREFFAPYLSGAGYAGGAVYAGMNLFLMAPVLLDAGKEMRAPAFSAMVCAAGIFAAASVILGCVFREGASALNAEMPFLYVMRGKRLFSLAVALAIMTSLASSLYPLMSLSDRFSGRKRYAAKSVLLLTAFGCSRLGLGGIVEILYPVEGFAGLVFSVVCILYEYLFEKRHKEIHSGGKDTEDEGGAHHEVELEDLPAVHDEITEPRL